MCPGVRVILAYKSGAEKRWKSDYECDSIKAFFFCSLFSSFPSFHRFQRFLQSARFLTCRLPSRRGSVISVGNFPTQAMNETQMTTYTHARARARTHTGSFPEVLYYPSSLSAYIAIQPNHRRPSDNTTFESTEPCGGPKGYTLARALLSYCIIGDYRATLCMCGCGCVPVNGKC